MFIHIGEGVSQELGKFLEGTGAGGEGSVPNQCVIAEERNCQLHLLSRALDLVDVQVVLELEQEVFNVVSSMSSKGWGGRAPQSCGGLCIVGLLGKRLRELVHAGHQLSKLICHVICGW